MCGVAAVVFWLAWDNGTYDPVGRYSLGIVVWWAIALGVATGVLPRTRLSRSAKTVAALLATFSLWTLASATWAPSTERAYTEFTRSSLMVGIFLLVAMTVRPSELGRLADGLCVGIVGVGLVAFASRLVPGPFPVRGIPEFLPGAVTRLSFPLGYWNGLAIFLALAVPLLLRSATEWRHVLSRSLAVAAIVPVLSAIYLTSSRGGVAAVAVGAVAFLALTGRRWLAAGAIAAGFLGGFLAVRLLVARQDLVNGPLGTHAVHAQGRSAAVLIAAVSLCAGAVFAAVERLLKGRSSPPRTVGWAVAGVAVIVVALGIVESHPRARFDGFKAPPGAIAGDDFVKAHLLSVNGSGRWQNWAAAIDAWRTEPLHGIGAGGYEEWWAQHGSIALFVRDAHSLYAEALGELGIVGLALLVAALGLGLVVGSVGAVRSSPPQRQARAALLAVAAAFAVAAAIDWMWELTVVAAMGLAALAGAQAKRDEDRSQASTGWLARAPMLGIALTVIGSQAVALGAQTWLDQSRTAASQGSLAHAGDLARRARTIEPWAATPRLQLALVAEQRADLKRALSSIKSANRRDSQDWRLWLIRARLETKAGDPRAGALSLARAVALNPRSSLFSRLRGGGAP